MLLNFSFQISSAWVLDMPVFSMYIKYPTKLPTAQTESVASQPSDCFNRGSDENTFQNLERTFKLLQSLRMKYLSNYIFVQFYNFHEKEVVVLRSCNSHIFSAKNVLDQWSNIHLITFLHTWHFVLSAEINLCNVLWDDPAWAGGWTRWPTVIPFNLNQDCVIPFDRIWKLSLSDELHSLDRKTWWNKTLILSFLNHFLPGKKLLKI